MTLLGFSERPPMALVGGCGGWVLCAPQACSQAGCRSTLPLQLCHTPFQMLWLSFFGCESTLNKTTVACGLTICPLRPYEGPRILVSSLTCSGL